MSNLPLAKNPLSATESNIPSIDVSNYLEHKITNPLSCAELLRLFYDREYGIYFDNWEKGLSVRDTTSCWRVLNEFLDAMWSKTEKPNIGDIAIIENRGPHILINVGKGLYLQSVSPRPVKMRKIRDVVDKHFFGFYALKEKQ